jgi:peptidoglycan/xylan/chitin deacetylase (PgdA/CDA1 family)
MLGDKLPILMYHAVAPTQSEGLAISSEKLEEQFKYLVDKGYKTYHFNELMGLNILPSKNNIVLTFDDAYVSQLEFAYPLLQKYKLKATFFIPMKYIGQQDYWNEITAPIMDLNQLQSLDPGVIELAYHSYAHKNYNKLSEAEVQIDTLNAFNVATESQLPLQPYLAYPYGKYPKKDPKKSSFFQQLDSFQFQLGLRIGNRVNSFPLKDLFEVQRIDVKGEWSFRKFRKKIRFGKWV